MTSPHSVTNAPATRILLAIRPLLLIGFGLLHGPANTVVYWSCMAAFALMALGVASGALPAVLGAAPGRLRLAHYLALVGFGVVPVPLFFVLGIAVDLALAGPLIAVVILMVVAIAESRLQGTVAGILVVGWIAALVWEGPADLGVLATEAGAVALVAAIGLRLRATFDGSVLAASEERAAAERRTRLLASIARLNTLEPTEVLRGVGRGLLDVGFDIAVVRRVDPVRGVAVLLDSASTAPIDLAEEVPIGDSIYARAAASHGVELVDPAVSTALRTPVRGLAILPVRVGERLVGFVSAGRVDAEVDATQLATAELLASEATIAIRRAEAFERDARTVEELRALDVRAHDFVSTVSHELRTPLTVIQGLGQTLRAHWDVMASEQRADLLARVEANSDRLGEMVGSLLDSSAVESGEFELTLAPVPLRALVDELLHRLPGVTAQHDVRVHVGAEIRVHVDRALFGHVLENLLTNVAKHTPPGTIVDVRAETRGDRVRISVQDDGPGIDPADLPHVLDRFYRGGDPDRRRTGGLGLGLALAADVVRAHGAELRVDSEVEVGTRFSFDVPAADLRSG